MRVLIVLALSVLVAGSWGCASRYDELRARSREVGRALEAERDSVLSERAESAEARERLGYLSRLRATLSAVNVGLAAVRYGLGESERPLAYDAVEEAYDTIEWNIPLGPGDSLRAMPAAFDAGRFDVDRFKMAE